MTELAVCSLADIPDAGAHGYEVVDSCGPRRLILTRRGSVVYAYLNSCPHTGVRLDWRPGDFLDISARYLQCATHAALFEPETGRCIAGPCVGSHLIPVESRVDATGTVLVSKLSRLPESAGPS